MNSGFQRRLLDNKLFRAAMAFTLLLFLASVYVTLTAEHRPLWVDIPRVLFFGLAGIFVLFDSGVPYMRSTRYGLAAIAFVLAALNAASIFVGIGGLNG